MQNTIGGFAQTEGVVKKIDATSRDLKDAILKGARIIITTIQKFGTEHLATISGHSSDNTHIRAQSGRPRENPVFEEGRR